MKCQSKKEVNRPNKKDGRKRQQIHSKRGEKLSFWRERQREAERGIP